MDFGQIHPGFFKYHKQKTSYARQAAHLIITKAKKQSGATDPSELKETISDDFFTFTVLSAICCSASWRSQVGNKPLLMLPKNHIQTFPSAKLEHLLL